MFDFDIVTLLYYIPGIIIGFSLHEFGHAIVASKLGDPTPGREGRLTLSPFAHLDPFGLIFLIVMQFGWAKPVNIDPRYFKNPVRDNLLVALAGPLTNLIIGILFIIFLKVYVVVGLASLAGPALSGVIGQLFFATAIVNVRLCIFNLLPLSPLDGFTIVEYFTPKKYYSQLEFLRTNSMIIFIGILIIGMIIPSLSPFTYIVTIPSMMIINLIQSIIF